MVIQDSLKLNQPDKFANKCSIKQLVNSGMIGELKGKLVPDEF